MWHVRRTRCAPHLNVCRWKSSNYETKENLYDWLPLKDRVYKEKSEDPVVARSYVPPRDGDEELDSSEWTPEELPSPLEGSTLGEGRDKNRLKEFAPMRRERKLDASGRAYGRGARKSATAQVWLSPRISRNDGAEPPIYHVNRNALHEYFAEWPYRDNVLKPLVLTHTLGRYHVRVAVRGGGKSAQSQAARMAVARALQNTDPAFRPVLKEAGYLKRDPRVKEEKKTGRKKARKKKQWSKR